MCNTFDRKLDEIKTIGIQIGNTTWYSHAISIGPYYDDYFTLSQKQEIAKELVRYSAIAGVVDTLAFILPQRNQMVSTPGWGKTDSIMSLIGIKSPSDQKILENELENPQYFEFLNLQLLGVSESFPYSFAIVQGVDYTSLNPRASILILLNNNILDNYIKKFKPEKVIGFSILQNGNPLYTYRQAGSEKELDDDHIITLCLSSQNYQCEYEVKLEPYTGTKMQNLILIMTALLILCISLGYVVSYLLTIISYRPIARLLRQTETDRQEADEFAGIEGSFHKLENEKNEMEQQMQLYYCAARSNFLHSLLRGYFIEENTQQALQDYQIPYDDSQVFRVVLCNIIGKFSLVCCKNLQVFLAVQNYLKTQNIIAEIVKLSATELALILCGKYDNDKMVLAMVADMQSWVQKQTECSVTVCCGTSEQRLLGISKSFQNAKERLTTDYFEGNDPKILIAGKNSAYYYPTDWEIQLINSLKVGNEKTALKIVCELCEENIGRNLSQGTKIKIISLVFETIVRVIDELGMDTVKPVQEFEENLTQHTDKKQWQYLCQITQTVCRRSSYADGDEQNGNVGRSMLAYVEQNYQNSGLSLKDLSREFNLSASAVSRTFKTTAKICFYDYLCRIRMEKAKEYFRSGQHSVAITAKQIGYENELSFRRAFLRYEGITPREYIIKHLSSN